MDRLDAGALAIAGLEARVLERCSSTNSLLLAEGRAGVLLAAEAQTAGRGRRGRRWHCAPGAGITFSISLEVERPAGLSLAAGVAAAHALRKLGASGVELKWPNDLVLGGAKLGGILVETRSRLAVIGIGINCRSDPALARRVRRPVAALDQCLPGLDRNRIIAAIAGETLREIRRLQAHGLEPLVARWQALDAHRGARMRVRLADGRVLSGIARGLEADGALRLETRRGLQAVHSGHVLAVAKPAGSA